MRTWSVTSRTVISGGVAGILADFLTTWSRFGEHRGMPRASVNGIELEYETFGDSGDPPLLLVMGLGAQMVSWDLDFCEALVGRGFFVIRFDNRDVGLSTKIECDEVDLLAAVSSALAGEVSVAPYLLTDMGSDAWAL